MTEPKKNSNTVMIRIGFDEELTERAEELLSDLQLDDVADKVTVNWNKRLRTTAGRAYSNLAKIELNPRLQQILPEEKREEEINQTFLHELAHVVEPNHTPEFWRIVARSMPEYEQRKTWLAEHGGQHLRH